MWASFKEWFKRLSTGRQYAVVLGTGFVVLLLIGAVSGGGEDSGSSSGGDEAAVTTSEATTTGNTADTPPPAPTARGTIREAVNEVDPGDGVRSVSIKRTEPSGYRVVVRFDSADNLTRGLRRAGVENDMRDIYKGIYTSSATAKVQEVQIEAWSPLIDKYGNESDGSVFTTVLDSSTAEQINWDNAEGLDFNDIWLQTFKLDDF